MLSEQTPAPSEDPTFKQWVEAFWEGFVKLEPELRQSALNKDGEAVARVTAPLMGALSPLLVRSYGSDRTSGVCSFTLSPGGCPHVRFLTEHWLKSAPTLAGWEFFPSWPPEDIEHATMEMGGRTYSASKFRVTPEIDAARKWIHLTAWCPGFAGVEMQARWQILSLWLDRAIGEDRATLRVGKIDIHDGAPSGSFPLTGLRDFIDETENCLGWPPARPGLFSHFSYDDPSMAFPRGDLLIGHTSQPQLWTLYRRAEGKMADPLAGTGAGYYFIRCPNAPFPEEDALDARIRLQERLSAELQASGDGQSLGCAMSKSWTYIDLLLFDRRRSMDRVMEILRRDGTLQQATLHAFAGTPEEILAKL